jgi:hypothetical protein
MISEIIRNIERYLSLRRFNDPTFAGQLLQLQNWQQERISREYSDLQSSAEKAELLHFFMGEIYRGIELEHLGNRLEKTARLLDKLFTDLQLIHLAIEYNTVTGELDEILTSTLFEKMGAVKIDESSYSEACRQADLEQQQLHQIELIRHFAEESKDVVQNEIVYKAFKLARIPAKLGGLGSLHSMINRGFNAMRQVEDCQHTINEIVQRERDFYEAIYQTVEESHT